MVDSQLLNFCFFPCAVALRPTCVLKPCSVAFLVIHRLQHAPERLYIMPRARESAAELATKLGARCLSWPRTCAWNNFKCALKVEPVVVALSVTSQPKVKEALLLK